jgi:hypothetical protein
MLIACAQILDSQPDLVRTDMAYENEHQVVHYAVSARLPEMVRLLMQRGADARKGVWPHRAATTALVIARDRGYDEIVAIIEDQEKLRNAQPQPGPESAARDQLMQASGRNDEDAILRILEAHPSLIQEFPWRLHAAACKRFARLAAWLLGHGSDVNSLMGDRVPLDMAAGCALYTSLDKARKMMLWLREHGAELTPRAAVALGEVDWPPPGLVKPFPKPQPESVTGHPERLIRNATCCGRYTRLPETAFRHVAQRTRFETGRSVSDNATYHFLTVGAAYARKGCYSATC